MVAKITPRFPKKGYVGAVWIHTGPETTDELTSFPYPLDELYTDPNDFIHDALLIPRLPAYGRELTVSAASLLIPLTLVRTIPLTPEMYANPTVNFDSFLRLRTFLKAMRAPSEYHILVLPQIIDHHRRFSPAFPFLKEAQQDAVGLFLHTTDYPTDPSATHAAIYKADRMIAVDLTTREIVRQQKSELAN